MKVFKDDWFCPFYKDCACGYDCDRKLTDEIYEQAKVAGLPIDRVVIQPECFEEK